MALKLKRDASMVFEVVAPVLVGDSFLEDKFTLKTIRIDRPELQSILDSKNCDEKLLRRVVVGWDGITDENGAPVPFTPENFEAFLVVVHAVRSSASKYVAVVSGVKEKN